MFGNKECLINGLVAFAWHESIVSMRAIRFILKRNDVASDITELCHRIMKLYNHPYIRKNY